jgi:hypothetical protein
MWITVEVDRVLRVDRGRNIILCDPMLGPQDQTLVLKLKGNEMTDKPTSRDEIPTGMPSNWRELLAAAPEQRALIDEKSARRDERKERTGLDVEEALTLADAEPVAWRWRQRGATLWVYDPTPEWRETHKDEVEIEPLYGAPAQAAPVIERLTAKADEQATALDQIMTTASDNLAAPGSDLKMTLEFIHHVAEHTLAVTLPQHSTGEEK